MSVHCLYAQCPRKLVDIRSPRTGVTDGCEKPCVRWEWKPGPTEEQPVLLLPTNPLSTLPHLPCALYSVRWRWHLLSCCEDWLPSGRAPHVSARSSYGKLWELTRQDDNENYSTYLVFAGKLCWALDHAGRMTFPLRVKSFFVIEKKNNGQNHVSSHLLPLITKCNRVRHCISYLLF